MAPVSPSQNPEHIPAWKRLGLKLKSAGNQENLEPIASLQLPNHTSRPESNIKRPRHQSTYSNEGPPTKKAKNSKPSKSNLSPPPEPHSPSLKKRKSVSFTPETKVEDGDSIKQLFNAWLDQQKQEDPSFATKSSNQAFKTPEPPQVVEQVEDTTLTESEKRVKRIKRSEKTKKGEVSSNSSETPIRLSPALSYLRQYHDSRSTWKFNKNHQIFIIKHIFDTSKIPLDYTNLLHHYITGMQGVIRTRLRDEALKVKIQDQEAGATAFPPTMSDPDKKQQEYNAAMSEYVATVAMPDAEPAIGYEEGIALNLSDPTMKDRVGKRMRAERILVQLSREPQNEPTISGGASGSGAGNGDNQKRMRLNDGSSQKTARRRKLRTATSAQVNDDDDTSSSGDSEEEQDSSEESSSSDSDEDSSEDGGVVVIRRGDGEETSSSSESSSSSGSEDSDEEEEDGDDGSEED